jgi:hypothetical protein
MLDELPREGDMAQLEAEFWQAGSVYSKGIQGISWDING